MDLTVSPGPASWSITSGDASGRLSTNNGTTVTYTAPDRKKTVTIQATGQGCTCSITLEVIEPTNLLFKKASEFWHKHGLATCGYLAQVFVQPDTVSFEYIEIRELNSEATLSGFYDVEGWRGIKHQGKDQDHSDWKTIGQPVSGKGSPGIGWLDKVKSGYPGGRLKDGDLTFPITWQFHVGSGAEKDFPHFTQHAHVDGSTGRCTQEKDGESKYRDLDDPDSDFED